MRDRVVTEIGCHQSNFVARETARLGRLVRFQRNGEIETQRRTRKRLHGRHVVASSETSWLAGSVEREAANNRDASYRPLGKSSSSKRAKAETRVSASGRSEMSSPGNAA